MNEKINLSKPMSSKVLIVVAVASWILGKLVGGIIGGGFCFFGMIMVFPAYFAERREKKEKVI